MRDHGSKQERVNLEDKTGNFNYFHLSVSARYLIWGCCFKLCFLYIFILELKSFLEEHKKYWAKKLEEVEEKFLELDQCQVTLQEPKQKKRKRSQKKPQAELSDNFSKFAAELQIEFFHKVHDKWFLKPANLYEMVAIIVTPIEKDLPCGINFKKKIPFQK